MLVVVFNGFLESSSKNNNQAQHSDDKLRAHEFVKLDLGHLDSVNHGGLLCLMLLLQFLVLCCRVSDDVGLFLL